MKMVIPSPQVGATRQELHPDAQGLVSCHGEPRTQKLHQAIDDFK